MREFLNFIKDASLEDIEPLYPREVFFHYEKILSYKMSHYVFSNTLN